MSINKIMVIGNLGADPDFKIMPDGKSVVTLSVACSEKWKDKQSGKVMEKTEWIRVVMFGKRAEAISEYFKKGSQIYVEGKLRTRDWEKDGIKHYITEVIAHEFQFCGNRPENTVSNSNTRVQQHLNAYESHKKAITLMILMIYHFREHNERKT